MKNEQKGLVKKGRSDQSEGRKSRMGNEKKG